MTHCIFCLLIHCSHWSQKWDWIEHLFWGNWSQRRPNSNRPPEEYSGVTETKIKTLTFSSESWRTKHVDWILIEWQSFPLLCTDATEISNMAAGGPFNMASVGNNKSILWSSQFRSLKVWFAYKHRALSGLFKMAANWLQNRFITTTSYSIQSNFWD